MAKTYIQTWTAAGSATTANTDQYWYFGGGLGKSTTEANHQTIFRSAGTLSNAYVRLTANSCASNSTLITRKNSSNGGQSVTITASTTGEFQDSTNTDSISAGDKVCWRTHHGAATGTLTITILSDLYQATTNTVTRCVDSEATNRTTASQTSYIALIGVSNVVNTSENPTKMRMRKAGTFKNAGCYVSANRAQATTIKLRKNGANATTTFTITGGGAAGWYEDTSNTNTVTSGEDWNWSCATGTGSDTLTIQNLCVDFESTAGDGFMGNANMDTSTANFADNTTNYNGICGSVVSGNSTEGNHKADAREAFVLSDFQLFVSNNDVTSASTVDVRKNGASTTLSISVTASTTGLFSDNETLAAIATTDELNYMVVVPSVAGSRNLGIANMVLFTHIDDLTRVSQSGTYKYNMDARVSLSRIYKYHVQSRISLSRVYKYHVQSRISLSRIYKYHILRKVGATCFVFDGTDDLSSCGNHVDLWSQALTKFSFSVWIKADIDGNGGANLNIVSHGATTAQGFRLHLPNAVDTIRFSVRNAANTSIDADKAGTSFVGRWTHCTCVYDSTLGSGNIKLVVDGNTASPGTANLTETINLSANLLLADSSADFDGKLKDFRFWAGTALTNAQIQDVYNNTTPPTPNYWLPLQEGISNPTDVISGTRTSTLQNGLAWGFDAPTQWFGKNSKFTYNMIGRISLSRIYKWHVQARISLSRIYKYHVTSRVSLARTYLYNVLGRVSRSRTYLYNVIGRISQSRIYKYHVQGRISLSKIYKYHIVSRVSLSRIYKYHLNARVSLQRIYKYHVQARVSRTRTYLYNLVGRVSLTRIYRYNVLGRVSLARSYLYHVIGRVSLARVYKYHVQSRVSLTRVYLWNLLQRVSLSRVYKYNLVGRISLSRSYLYNVVGRVSHISIFKYDVLGRVSLSRIYKYHLQNRVSLSRIYKYHVQSRVSLARSYLYNIVGRISKSATYKWDLQSRVSRALTLLWDVASGDLTRVSKPQIYLYHVVGRISKQQTYKYHLTNYVSLSRIYKWHVLQRVSLSRTYLYNLIGRISLIRIYKYDLIGRISKSSTLLYNVIGRISLSRVYKYHIQARVSLARSYLYNVLSKVSLVRIYKYNVQGRVSLDRTYKFHVLGRVSKTASYLYNVIGRVSLGRIYKYNVNARVSLTRIYRYHLLGRVSLARTYLWDVISGSLERVSKSQIYLWNINARISLARVYKHNVVARVSVIKVYKYHILSHVSQTRTYLWNITNRISQSSIFKYSVMGRVSLSSILRWDLGFLETKREGNITGRIEGKQRRPKGFDRIRDYFYRDPPVRHKRNSKYRRG